MSRMSNRIAYGQALTRLGEINPKVVVFDADLANATNTVKFAEKFPKRFFNMGIAEQNMMTAAAGMATMGFIPFVSTFAIFASMRAVEQFRNMIAYPNLNVKVVVTHAGIENGRDGASHQTVEDIAIMRAIPNVKVIIPSDHVSTSQILPFIAAIEGPVYLRLGRSENQAIYNDTFCFELGKSIELFPGNDVTIMAVGSMVEKAISARKILESRGIQARVLDMLSIKPFDEEATLKAAKETQGIVTVEEHSVIGGLGGAVSEFLTEHQPCRVLRVGIADRFGCTGDGEELKEKLGLSIDRIISRVEELL